MSADAPALGGQVALVTGCDGIVKRLRPPRSPLPASEDASA